MRTTAGFVVSVEGQGWERGDQRTVHAVVGVWTTKEEAVAAATAKRQEPLREGEEPDETEAWLLTDLSTNLSERLFS